MKDCTKNFIKKIVIVSAPVIIVFSFLIIYDKCDFNGKVINPGVEKKIYDLIVKDKQDVKIIIGGDSRAERQIIPKIIEQKMNLKSKNIAVSSGDTYSLFYYLKKYDVLEDKKIIILSLSFPFGSCQPLYGFKKNYPYRDFVKKLGDYNTLGFSILKNFLKNTKQSYGDDGFLGVEGNIPFPIDISLDPNNTNHPFYKKINYACSTWEDTKRMIEEMAQSGLKLVIYQPPISPSWREYIKNSFIEQAENNYSQMLSQELKKHKNTHFLDYFSSTTPLLTDDTYYDIQHLNQEGAEIFTEILIKDLDNISVF